MKKTIKGLAMRLSLQLIRLLIRAVRQEVLEWLFSAPWDQWWFWIQSFSKALLLI
ncbi:hypothetical protein QAO71_10665 [Halopseudomonas sp. SMJS2]|uniref:hypothetical protein n=1 Tax=Halopseudomonas sp. SMJS2 TaxID=3041098 RepID=UPI002452B8C1|nr:hypothetical protein [Halopseudomonas sp. SMJS2]WGK60555.1 hypothetical protein QAO71_10665 [Halopseudomonas sp. SMJS2]